MLTFSKIYLCDTTILEKVWIFIYLAKTFDSPLQGQEACALYFRPLFLMFPQISDFVRIGIYEFRGNPSNIGLLTALI